jgi:hypothetical protein
MLLKPTDAAPPPIVWKSGLNVKPKSNNKHHSKEPAVADWIIIFFFKAIHRI